MWRYWFDFIAFPAVAIAIAVLDCRSADWLAFFGLGVLLWTLAEYWVHRTLLHLVLFSAVHEQHHRRPRAYVIFPLWQTPAIFAAFFLVMPLPVFAGFVAGYCWFIAWHHLLHHVLLKRPAMRRYAAWHIRHHRASHCNYGITTPVWDVVFRTYARG